VPQTITSLYPCRSARRPAAGRAMTTATESAATAAPAATLPPCSRRSTKNGTVASEAPMPSRLKKIPPYSGSTGR
jgi:hypothetical protein